MKWSVVAAVICCIGVLDLPAAAPAQDEQSASVDVAAAPAPTEGDASVDENGQQRRDPFRPFTLDLRPHQPSEPLTPLQRYELGQLTVTGIVWNLRTPVAMVEDDAGMGFIVSPGTLIGRQHGIVKAIEPGRIIVEEKTYDFYGQQQLQQVVMEIPKDGDAKGGGQERP